MADSLADWIAEHPLPDSAYRQSLAGVARRTLAGEPFMLAARELLQEFSLAQSEEQRARAIAEEPEATGDARYDAYLGALGEHLAVPHGLTPPPWTCAPGRFLERFWFVSEIPGFRAQSIAQAPAAFRRRGIFVPERSLQRV